MIWAWPTRKHFLNDACRPKKNWRPGKRSAINAIVTVRDENKPQRGRTATPELPRPVASTKTTNDIPASVKACGRDGDEPSAASFHA